MQLDIVPNGLEHALDVAMKRAPDAHFYGFNDDNSYAPELMLPAHRLNGDRCRVVIITLRAASADSIAQEYDLMNHGVGGTITLTQLPS